MRRHLSLGIPAIACATALSCVSPPITTPPVVVTQQTPIRVAQNIKNKVDVLFLVDNSASMEAMAAELRTKFDQFFTVFQQLASDPMNPTYADLNIGVVTSDYGAGATGAPGCQPYGGGQAGHLQALGQFAATGCLPPTGGAHFIHYNFANNGAQNNLPAGQNLVQTFTCMASVGASGCGFEHQLESVYHALHDNIAENQNFLRDDALLTVVFLTNEDDSSADGNAQMFDKSQSGMYGYEDSYRSTHYGIVCCPPGQSGCADSAKVLPPYGDSGGPLDGCIPAPGPNNGGPGLEFDVSRYIDFFTKPSAQGGVKVNPSDVILVGIDAPADPVQIILSNPGTAGGSPYVQCPQLNETSNPPCVPVLQHSCQNQANPVFFGDPAVRLDTVIKSVKANAISSICDNDYTAALQGLAKLIVSNIGGGCITSKLPDPSNPDCVVEDVTTNSDGTTTTTEIPSCASSGGATPCWKIEMKTACASQSPDGVGVTIDRGGQPAPANTEAYVACATVAGM